MTRAWTIPIAWLGLLGLLSLQACARASFQSSTSGSNWLTCMSIDDCADGRAASCSEDGYCLDAQGERLAAMPGASTTDPQSEPDGGGGGDAAVVDPPPSAAATACEGPREREPLVAAPPDETCYDLVVHGASGEDDQSPFRVMAGEAFSQFSYAIPWPEGSLATAYGVIDESEQAFGAFLVSTELGDPPGAVQPNVIGTFTGREARLLGAWGMGGCNVVMPDDVGLELPDAGTVTVQWHYYNGGEEPIDVRSAFRVCTMPRDSRAHHASVTLVGTEDLNTPTGIPPGTTEVRRACLNGSSSIVTVVGLYPYMHYFGERMTGIVQRAAGGSETVLDAPFVFADPHAYRLAQPAELGPRDSIETVCTFRNTTSTNVLFGTSSGGEMCFQLAFAHPARALDNGVASLFGVTNTCW